MSIKSFKYLKILLVVVLNILALSIFLKAFYVPTVDTLSKVGSSGTEVTQIQQALKDRGLFTVNVTGYYGTITQRAVRKFQQQQGLTVDGIAGPQTLRALGIMSGTVPTATEANINLLARIISAEARGEAYIGQVAVGAVVLNRVEHPSFPDSLSGVIYQPGAFTAITDGQYNEPISTSAYNAAKDAINGWDPSGGALYYYNPKRAISAWIFTRPIITVIGKHRFCS